MFGPWIQPPDFEYTPNRDNPPDYAMFELFNSADPWGPRQGYDGSNLVNVPGTTQPWEIVDAYDPEQMGLRGGPPGIYSASPEPSGLGHAAWAFHPTTAPPAQYYTWSYATRMHAFNGYTARRSVAAQPDTPGWGNLATGAAAWQWEGTDALATDPPPGTILNAYIPVPAIQHASSTPYGTAEVWAWHPSKLDDPDAYYLDVQLDTSYNPPRPAVWYWNASRAHVKAFLGYQLVNGFEQPQYDDAVGQRIAWDQIRDSLGGSDTSANIRLPPIDLTPFLHGDDGWYVLSTRVELPRGVLPRPPAVGDHDYSGRLSFSLPIDTLLPLPEGGAQGSWLPVYTIRPPRFRWYYENPPPTPTVRLSEERREFWG